MFTAAMLFLKGVPAWAYGLLIIVAMAGAGMIYEREEGAAGVQAKWDADKAARAASEKAVVATRTAENVAQAAKQAASAVAITKVHDDEMSSVRAQLAAAQRMRLPGFCANRGPAAQAGTASAAGGDGADPAGGLLPVEVDRNIKALILETEQAAATGRACQTFVRDNGMALQ
jgi:hypothetical protein